MSPRKIVFIVLCALVVSATRTRTADQILIAAGSVWRYSDTGSNLGTAWRATAYSDAAWKTGAAELGYGDGGEVTTVLFGGNTSNRYITTYFRRAFTVATPSSVAALTVRFVRDDGAVIYLNGTEVVRSNMPTGTIASTTLASAAIGGADESAWLEAPVDPSLLLTGTNVLAVEIHQQAVTSTDISFNLELRATEATVPAPAVSLVSPAHGATSNASSVTFRASATAAAGLASATLFVGGPPQTVIFSGAAQLQDAQITADTPTTRNGSGSSINVDGLTPHAHGLLKAPSLIGSGAGRVPAGAIIASAVLRLNCTNAGNTMRLYRLTQDWNEDEATWNERALGSNWGAAGADGAASNAGTALVGDCTVTGQRSIDVTPFVQQWSDGAPNYGVVLIESGTDGIDFTSSESTGSPILTVVYRSNPQAVGTQALAGTSSELLFTGDLPLGQTYYWNVRVTDSSGRQGWAASDFALTLDASAPDEPILVSPLNGATDVGTSPTLSAAVSDPSGGALTVSARIRPMTAPEFTIIALPDTQHYSEAFPAIFTSQTQWIVNNKAARNIVFVTHEGDIVEHNSVVLEWDRANASLSLLDGVVPYGMGPGNHDQPTTLYNQYFPYTRYEGRVPWYGGHFQNLNDNNYQLFSGGGMDFVIVHMQFCPPAAAVAWADSIYKTYPNRIGIMTTHGYLNESAQRTVGGCSNTQYLWDGLALPNPNLHFMLSGHVHDESRRVDTANGHPVFQMLADFQDRASGGEGWLRILRFVPAEDKVYVQTYSPWLNRYETDANSEFTLDFPMGGVFTSAGSVVAASGSTAAIAPPELAQNTEYEWQMTVTNSSGRSRTGPIWHFTTGSGGPVDQPPVATSQSVGLMEDASAAIALDATDPEGGALTYAVVSGPAHGSLSGTAPALVYQPAANYNGADSFTFRANDGHANSNVATVAVAVAPVNDSPVAAGNSYSVTTAALTVSAPGVLGNDTDVDGGALTAQLVAGPTHGILSLSANGAFTYTPTTGYSGADSFTYQATDGAATSAAASVSLTVTPPAPSVVFSANFSSGQNSFTYADNTFRGATQSNYASGSRVTTGGGALQVLLGGIDGALINGMSGGWRRTFTLSAAAAVSLTFRYNLDQGADYESDEISQILASIDGALVASTPGGYIAQVAGNGNGGTAIGTGWQSVTLPLGTLAAGTHTLTLGGYNSKKNGTTERTTILIDDVSVTTP